jgi:hypothetical protein
MAVQPLSRESAGTTAPRVPGLLAGDGQASASVLASIARRAKLPRSFCGPQIRQTEPPPQIFTNRQILPRRTSFRRPNAKIDGLCGLFRLRRSPV